MPWIRPGWSSWAIVLLSCGGGDGDDPAASATFSFEIADRQQARRLIDDGTLSCSACSLRPAEVDGRAAVEVRTAAEFSDAFLDLAALTGGPVDFTAHDYLHFELLVPDSSWVSAVKFNFRDAEGNLGGVPEAANGFYGSGEAWVRGVADLRRLRRRYQTWRGDGSALADAIAISFNPYTAHQADSSSYFIRGLALGDEVLPGYREPLVPRPASVANDRYTITFDDRAWLARQGAYRTFESSYQAFAEGVAGNPTRAIRLKGKTDNRYIAFLPEVEPITGHPVDLSAAERIRLRYYLVPGGDPVDGATLHIVTEGWRNQVIDTLAIEAFEAGSWREATIELDDLDLFVANGDLSPEEILRGVHSVRLDLNYRGKDVEMWVDDFGWE